jgi:hypothetical protein
MDLACATPGRRAAMPTLRFPWRREAGGYDAYAALPAAPASANDAPGETPAERPSFTRMQDTEVVAP